MLAPLKSPLVIFLKIWRWWREKKKGEERSSGQVEDGGWMLGWGQNGLPTNQWVAGGPLICPGWQIPFWGGILICGDILGPVSPQPPNEKFESLSLRPYHWALSGSLQDEQIMQGWLKGHLQFTQKTPACHACSRWTQVFYTIMLRIFLTNCWKVRKRLSRHNLTN